MSSGHQRITWLRNIAENFNRLSRVHERYRRQTDDRRQTDRQTDGRRHIANMNMSSRSLKTQRKHSKPRRQTPLRFFSHSPFVIGWASSSRAHWLYAFRPVRYHLLPWPLGDSAYCLDLNYRAGKFRPRRQLANAVNE